MPLFSCGASFNERCPHSLTKSSEDSLHDAAKHLWSRSVPDFENALRCYYSTSLCFGRSGAACKKDPLPSVQCSKITHGFPFGQSASSLLYMRHPNSNVCLREIPLNFILFAQALKTGPELRDGELARQCLESGHPADTDAQGTCSFLSVALISLTILTWQMAKETDAISHFSFFVR